MALKIRISGEVGDNSPIPKSKSVTHTVKTSEALQAVLDTNPDEMEVYVDINSLGGSVYEGLAMFDVLRTSGRNVHTNIIGGCHSIATIILLAAPLKWRASNPNSRSLIHKPRIDPGASLTAPELTQCADSAQREEERIIQIYTERTKLTEAQARAVIEAEKTHTAQDLLKMGFISKINPYTTNSFNDQKNKIMAKKQNDSVSLLERIGGFLVNAAKVLSPSNFNYEDAEGTVLFSTASESDDIAVGTEVAFPDDTTGGTFELPDGRVVMIEDFIVTVIDTVSDETEALRTENEALKTQLMEAVNLVEDLKGQISSTYAPQNRVTKPSTATRTARQTAVTASSKDAIKNEVKESHAQGFGFRGITAPRTK